MADAGEPIQIELTPEQQQLIERLSGQRAQLLELNPETPNTAAGGRGLKFRWKLSTGEHPAGGSTPQR